MGVNLENLNQALAKVKEAHQAPIINAGDVLKGISTANGLVAYDLQPAAKLLYPVLTPLRNEIPRIQGDGGTATNWKAVTGINTKGLSIGTAEGRRNAVIDIKTVDRTSAYKTIGLENSVTMESQMAGVGFDDIRALAVRQLLESLMIGEEPMLIFGNGTRKLGTVGQPTCKPGTTGSLAAGDYYVACVAMTYEGYANASVVGGVPTEITRNNADGTQEKYGGGSSKASPSSAKCTVVAGGSIGAGVPNVRAAVAYAWFWSQVAGSEKLGAITTTNSVNITALPTGTQPVTECVNDNSVNALMFDGFFSQMCYDDSPSIIKMMPTGTEGVGTQLTAAPDGIVEFDQVLKQIWDTYKTSPEEILVGTDILFSITKKLLSLGSSAPLFRFNMDATQGGVNNLTLSAGAIIGSYLNKAGLSGGQLIPVRLHPNMPAGMVIFRRKTLPYPMSNLANVMEVRYQQDYYQIEWPLRTRAYEYGTYARLTMPLYAPFSFAAIVNIGV